MLLDVPADQYRVLLGCGTAAAITQPLGFGPPRPPWFTPDGHTPDLAELLQEMADRTENRLPV